MMVMMMVIQLRPVVGSIIQRSPVTIIQQGGSKANHQTFSNEFSSLPFDILLLVELVTPHQFTYIVFKVILNFYGFYGT